EVRNGMFGYKQHSIRVLVVDEECVVRASLAALVSSWNAFQIIGGAETKHEALTQFRLYEPDVVLVSLAGSEAIDTELVHELTSACGGSRVIVLVGQYTEDFAFQLMQCRAARVLGKCEHPTKLKEAIQDVYRRQ